MGFCTIIFIQHYSWDLYPVTLDKCTQAPWLQACRSHHTNTQRWVHRDAFFRPSRLFDSAALGACVSLSACNALVCMILKMIFSNLKAIYCPNFLKMLNISGVPRISVKSTHSSPQILSNLPLYGCFVTLNTNEQLLSRRGQAFVTI